MANYAYRGRDAAGQVATGVIDAPSSSAAADQLGGRGIIPLSISETTATASAGNESGDGWKKLQGLFEEKVQEAEVMLFSRQIYTLLKAGVPIMRALGGLQESAASKAMKDVIQGVREGLDSGRELALSFSQYPKVFSSFYLSMVRVGEMTGRLEEIFLRLFHHMEFEAFMRDQIKSALRYPMFVVIAMVIAITVVNIWVIPAFARVFQGFGSELPLMTRILIGFSDFMVAYWYLLLGGVIAGVAGFKAWLGTKSGRYRWDKMKLSFPIAGKIIQKATLARFARSFALASKSGVPIIQALNTVALTVDNDYIADKISFMRDGVERGESVLRTALQARIFTPVVLQMIAVGEESGSLDDMMEEVADLYQREVEVEIKNLSASIEPILIVFLGILVLILALGIFLPIWDLGKAAMKK
jgi:MSHA biogenesis protein MshG